MDKIDDLIKSINGQVKKLSKEIEALINNASSLDDLNNAIKLLDTIKDNPSISHIHNDLEIKLEEKKQELNKPKEEKTSWLNEKGIVYSKYFEIDNYPSFLPYNDYFYMINSLWYLASADAGNNIDSCLNYFNNGIETILRFVRNENDRKEFIEFFNRLASIGGIAKKNLSQIVDKINAYIIDTQKAEKFHEYIKNPYKDILFDLSFVKEKIVLNDLKRKMIEINNSEAYNLMYEYESKRMGTFDNDEKKAELKEYLNRNEETINTYISYILGKVKTSSDLEEVKNVFSKFDIGYAKKVYKEKILPFIEEKEKKFNSQRKFNNIQESNNSYYEEEYNEIKHKSYKLYEELQEIYYRNNKSNSDLDEIDVIIAQYENLNDELDSIYTKLDRKQADELSIQLKSNLKTSKQAYASVEKLLNELNNSWNI